MIGNDCVYIIENGAAVQYVATVSTIQYYIIGQFYMKGRIYKIGRINEVWSIWKDGRI